MVGKEKGLNPARVKTKPLSMDTKEKKKNRGPRLVETEWDPEAQHPRKDKRARKKQTISKKKKKELNRDACQKNLRCGRGNRADRVPGKKKTGGGPRKTGREKVTKGENPPPITKDHGHRLNRETDM